jgi:hypothetical protein
LRASTAKFRKRGFIALFGVTSLVMVSAGPALAVPGEVVGENIGLGVESGGGVDDTESCIPIPILGPDPLGSTFDVIDIGTYDGLALGANPPIASYVGDTRVQLQTDPYYLSPEGTYTACPVTFPPPGVDPTAVDFIGITGNVTTPARLPDVLPGGNVNCNGLSGEFMRRAFDLFVIVLTGPCNIQGNVPLLTGSVEDVSTTHVITGVMHPCKVPIPPTDVAIPPSCLTIDEALDLAEDVPNVTPQQVLDAFLDISPSADDAGTYVLWNHAVLPADAPLP